MSTNKFWPGQSEEKRGRAVSHNKGVWGCRDEQDLTSASQSISISLTSYGKTHPRIEFSCYPNVISSELQGMLYSARFIIHHHVIVMM